jgi:hypothetical protein
MTMESTGIGSCTKTITYINLDGSNHETPRKRPVAPLTLINGNHRHEVKSPWNDQIQLKVMNLDIYI